MKRKKVTLFVHLIMLCLHVSAVEVISTASMESPTTSPPTLSAATSTSSVTSTSTLSSAEVSTTPSVSSITAPETSSVSSQTSTDALTSTTARPSPSTAAETSTASSTQTSTSEATTVMSLATTTAAETLRTKTQTSTEALPSTSAPVSSSTAAETSTASSTEASMSEAIMVTTALLSTSVAEASIASTKIATAATTSSSIPASTRTTASTSTLSATEGSTTEAMTFTLSISTTTAAETLTASSQTSTTAPSSISAPGSTNTVAEMSTASLTDATTMRTSLPLTSAVATEHLTVNTQTSTAAQTSTSAPAATSRKASTLAESSTTESITEVTPITISLTSTRAAKTSTTNTQTSTEALTSTTAPASTNTAAEMSTASSTQASISEVTTVTSLPMTTVAETSTASTQSPSTPPTPSAAPISTSTIASTSTLSSTEVSTTQATTLALSASSTAATARSTGNSETFTTALTATPALAQSMEPPIVPATVNPNERIQEKEFNITFTVLKLPFISTLQNRNSSSYKAESNNILDALSKLYAKSKVKSFLHCQSVSFRILQANSLNTLCSASCSVIVEPLIIPATVNPNEGTQEREFNITFTVLSLPFTPNLQNLSSPLYLAVSSSILDKLSNLYVNSKVKSAFLRCQSASFRPASDGNSTVEAICTVKKSADTSQTDKVQLYREFQNNTKGITALGNYTVDSSSLYVDGYHESAVLTTTSPTVTMTQTPSFEEKPIEFNVTFVITNLQFTESLHNSTSSLYKSVSKNISYQLTDLYNYSKINARFTDCKAVSFRPEDIANTRVYTICTFRNDSDPQEVNRITMYHAFRDSTKNISTLGAYTLDSNSLYVNGYHESTPLPTTLPTVSTRKTPSLEGTPIEFNMTFVITNLQFTESLHNSSSSLYNAVSKNISDRLTDLYDKSKINARFSDCKAVSFRPADVANTRVYAICTFRNDSDPQEVNRITMYHAFRDNTKNISALGTYTLDSNSLYVNGYHESTPLPTTLPTVSTTQTPIIKEIPLNST
ncbi:mucin-16-like [Rhincodon typus]|uniref:mucin-16-like n=1 Tax=Rhincodon typus TaxID=259920 RepID=UPI00202E8756|nr:mucin-16-like [Rhincodon typus]